MLWMQKSSANFDLQLKNQHSSSVHSHQMRVLFVPVQVCHCPRFFQLRILLWSECRQNLDLHANKIWCQLVPSSILCSTYSSICHLWIGLIVVCAYEVFWQSSHQLVTYIYSKSNAYSVYQYSSVYSRYINIFLYGKLHVYDIPSNRWGV